MRVPERFIGLLSYTRMSGRVHEQHAKQHDMSSDASGFRVVYLDGGLWANLGSFHVEEVDVMSRRVTYRPEQQ